MVLLALAPSAFAQGGRSEINGTVLDAGKAVLPGVTVTAINQDTGLERSAVSSPKASSPFRPCCPAPTPIKAELQGFQMTNLTGAGPERRPGADAEPDDAARGRRRNVDRDGAVAARRNDVEPHRHQRDQLGDRRPAERQPEPVQPDADDSRAGAGAAGRVVRRRPVQRQRPGDHQQPVPRRRAERQRLAPRRLAGHAGARVARLDGRVPGADAPVRGRVRRLHRRRREQRDQERHQQVVRPRVRVLPEQRAAGHQLLPETGGPGESRLGQQRVSAAASAARSSRTSCSSSRNYEGTSSKVAANLNFPAVGGAARRVVLDDDRVSWAEHVCAVRLPRERQQSGQLPLDARSRHHRARFDRERPGHARARRGTKTIRAIRCSACRGRRC